MGKADSFEAANYGEVIAVVKGMQLVSFEEDGGYSGKYLAVLRDGDRLYYYIGDYGSCSGCDWLEDVRDLNGLVPYREALNYVTSDLNPEYIVPVDRPLSFKSKGEYWGWELHSEDARDDHA